MALSSKYNNLNVISPDIFSLGRNNDDDTPVTTTQTTQGSNDTGNTVTDTTNTGNANVSTTTVGTNDKNPTTTDNTTTTNPTPTYRKPSSRNVNDNKPTTQQTTTEQPTETVQPTEQVQRPQLDRDYGYDDDTFALTEDQEKELNKIEGMSPDDIASQVENDYNPYTNPFQDEMENLYKDENTRLDEYIKKYADLVLPTEQIDKQEKKARQMQGMQNLANMLAAFGNLYYVRGGAPSQTLPDSPNKDLQAWKDRQTNNINKYLNLLSRVSTAKTNNLYKMSQASNNYEKALSQVERDRAYATKLREQAESEKERALLLASQKLKTDAETEKALADAEKKRHEADYIDANAEYKRRMAEVAEETKRYRQAQAWAAKVRASSYSAKVKADAAKAASDAASRLRTAKAAETRAYYYAQSVMDKINNPWKYRSARYSSFGTGGIHPN